MLSPRTLEPSPENCSFCSFANFNPIVLACQYRFTNATTFHQRHNSTTMSKVVLRTYLPNVPNFKSFISPHSDTCLAVYLPTSFKTPCYLCLAANSRMTIQLVTTPNSNSFNNETQELIAFKVDFCFSFY
jgi:hypothetical protein